MRKKLLRLLGLAAWTVGVVALVIGGVEWWMARTGRGEPRPEWLWDAFLLSPRPIFVPAPDDGELRVTHPWLVHAGNAQRRFRANKAPGTFRIFTVGASTTAGWPFQHRADYPRWLGAFLADVEPGPVEVVNAGINGFDSERVLGVVDELAAYQPDLVIMQTGYNDYSAFALRKAGLRARAHAWLVMRSRIYNTLLPRLVKPPQTAVSRGNLRLDDADERALIDGHARLLRRFARVLRERGVTPVLMNLAFTDRYRREHPTVKRVWPALSQAARTVALEERTGFVDVSALATLPDGLVDSMHGSVDGYRFTAKRVLDALCTQRLLPAPCHMERLRSDEEYTKALDIDDPRTMTASNLRLGAFYIEMGDDERADRALTAAERSAPSPDFVFDLVLDDDDPRLRERLERIDRQLGFTDRAERFARLRSKVSTGP